MDRSLRTFIIKNKLYDNLINKIFISKIYILIYDYTSINLSPKDSEIIRKVSKTKKLMSGRKFSVTSHYWKTFVWIFLSFICLMAGRFVIVIDCVSWEKSKDFSSSGGFLKGFRSEICFVQKSSSFKNLLIYKKWLLRLKF